MSGDMSTCQMSVDISTAVGLRQIGIRAGCWVLGVWWKTGIADKFRIFFLQNIGNKCGCSFHMFWSQSDNDNDLISDVGCLGANRSGRVTRYIFNQIFFFCENPVWLMILFYVNQKKLNLDHGKKWAATWSQIWPQPTAVEYEHYG